MPPFHLTGGISVYVFIPVDSDFDPNIKKLNDARRNVEVENFSLHTIPELMPRFQAAVVFRVDHGLTGNDITDHINMGAFALGRLDALIAEANDDIARAGFEDMVAEAAEKAERLRSQGILPRQEEGDETPYYISNKPLGLLFEAFATPPKAPSPGPEASRTTKREG